jgi:hypothetical protein
VVDGDTAQISLVRARQNYKNVIAHPHATLFIIDPKNPFPTLEIRGTVQVAKDPDLSLFEQVFRHYGHDPATVAAPREGRVAFTLLPTRVVTQD